MRLIDADALLEEMVGITDGWLKPPKGWKWYEDSVRNAPTVDVLQKLWNALYAEEDKLEKKYVGTPEHDKWFMVYRPWLQDGFGIAIKALLETFTPEQLKEGEVE